MAEEILQILENADCMFKEQNYQQAEELYTKFITSCLRSRYFFVILEEAITLVMLEVSHVKFCKLTQS